MCSHLNVRVLQLLQTCYPNTTREQRLMIVSCSSRMRAYRHIQGLFRGRGWDVEGGKGGHAPRPVRLLCQWLPGMPREACCHTQLTHLRPPSPTHCRPARHDQALRSQNLLRFRRAAITHRASHGYSSEPEATSNSTIAFATPAKSAPPGFPMLQKDGRRRPYPMCHNAWAPDIGEARIYAGYYAAAAAIAVQNFQARQPGSLARFAARAAAVSIRLVYPSDTSTCRPVQTSHEPVPLPALPPRRSVSGSRGWGCKQPEAHGRCRHPRRGASMRLPGTRFRPARSPLW